MDVSQSNDNDMGTTASVNYDNNVKQDMDKYMNNVEVIPDNNFEDGFENSEIIELNDTTIDGEEEEFVEDDTSTDSIRHIPCKVRGNGDTSAIVSNTTTALSVKVVLNKLTSTTYNTTFSGVNNCTVYYTLNGANPTTSSTKYTKAFVYDTSKTLKYFAVKANGECGAVLSMKLSEGSTPYIVYKTPITNQAQQVYISYTLPTTSIYYTINGSIPTTKSIKYNAPININNYTDLRFISVYGSITSNVYSYRMNAVKPVVTIKNITEVRDNHQNISITINKEGIIYYTRNGSIPNTNSNTWKNNTKVMVSIKTQVRAILIDNEGFISNLTFYQAPKIITPPIAVVKPLNTLTNNYQKIVFITNRNNSTIYYTDDGSNPFNSPTVHLLNNNYTLNLNVNSRIKYYTIDNEGYKSKTFNYTPMQHNQELPTLMIYNTTQLYSNNQQKILLQSNQPVTIYYTKNGTIPTIHSSKYNFKEITIKKDMLLNILIVTQNNQYINYQYQYNKTVKKVTPLIYSLDIPTYTNVTMPLVKYSNYTNSTTANKYYNSFIIKEGENGIIKVPFSRVFKIQINNQTHIFYHNMNSNNLGKKINEKGYYLSFNNNLNDSSEISNKKGVYIKDCNNSIKIVFIDLLTNNINQFSISHKSSIDTNLSIDGNNGIIFEESTITINNVTKVKIFFSENLIYNDYGLRYQIISQKNYQGSNWKTESYLQISKFNIPNMKYTSNNRTITFTTGYYGINKNIDETILSTILSNDKSYTKNEYISFRNFDEETGFESLQNYLITNRIITKNIVKEYLNISNSYDKGLKKAIYGSFLLSLTTTFLHDKMLDELTTNLNTTWNRYQDTIVLCGVNYEGSYINCIDANMGKTLHGDNYTNILINLISTITLSNIESKSLELTNLSITNSLEMLLDKIINNNQHSYIKKGDILIIQIDKSENKEQLILNLTTGIIKTVIVNNENIYKGVFSESNSFCFHDDLTDKITSNLLSEIDLPISKLLGGNTPNLKINISYYKESINWWLSTPIVSIASICIDVELSSILTMITTGNWIISFKNNQSTNTWQYYSYQINNIEGRTIYIKNNKTNYIDKIIVPFDDYGNYNRDNVTYIDSIKGAYIIPKNETYKYF